MVGVHVSIQKSHSHNSEKKSCKTSYESTQIGNESTQTEFIPGLSRPVWTRGEMVRRKMENESTQGVSESTQTGFPIIESTWESTCSDPKGHGSRKRRMNRRKE